MESGVGQQPTELNGQSGSGECGGLFGTRGNIERMPQDVLQDVSGAWRMVNHASGVLGHKRTGLSVALDGSEDHLLTREARECWQALNMPELRLAALAAVDVRVAAGTSIEDWASFVEHPTDPGIQGEGFELEGILADGERPWLQEDDFALLAADMKEGKEEPAAITVEARAEDDPEEVAEALDASRKMALLKRLRADASKANLPNICAQVDKQVSRLERGRKAKTAAEKKANAVLRRAVDKRLAEDAAKLRARRQSALEARINVAKIKARRARVADARRRAKQAEAARKAQLDALPKTWSLADLAGKKGKAAARAILDRLKLRAPALPLEQDARWPKIRDSYIRLVLGSKSGKAPGVTFLAKVNKVLKALGRYYEGKTTYKEENPEAGDAQAFAKFFAEMEKVVPKPATAVTL